eukprot:gene19549-977_t
MDKEEFKHLDERGLRKASSMERTDNEAMERVHYFKLYATITTNVAPLLCLATYALVGWLFPSQAAIQASKIQFITDHQLNWVYACWYVVFLTRMYMAINANGARSAARVDRPDQHCYKIMDPNAAKQSYILMENTGPVGRFNRAQRAAANMDESLPIFLVGLLLVAAVFGPIALGIATLNVFGRVRMANVYKQDAKKRLAGFVPAMFSEQITSAFVGLVVVKSFFGGLTSFF